MGAKNINNSDLDLGLSFLKRKGVLINKEMTSPKSSNKEPRPVWVVRGLTGKISDVLESLNGEKWDVNGHVTYSFYSDPRESIALEIANRLKNQNARPRKNPDDVLRIRRLKTAKANAEKLRHYIVGVEFGYIEQKEYESLEESRDKLAYYESLVREQQASRKLEKSSFLSTVDVGDFVKVKNSSVWHEVIRVNDNSVTLRGWLSIDSHTQRIGPDEIVGHAKFNK